MIPGRVRPVGRSDEALAGRCRSRTGIGPRPALTAGDVQGDDSRLPDGGEGVVASRGDAIHLRRGEPHRLTSGCGRGDEPRRAEEGEDGEDGGPKAANQGAGFHDYLLPF